MSGRLRNHIGQIPNYPRMKTALVTGVSTGIGRAVVQAASCLY